LLSSNIKKGPLQESIDSNSQFKVLLLVEPTPFNYISGYANRFKEMLKYLHRAGDKVEIVTSDLDEKPPTNFLSFPIHTGRGFRFPLYKDVILSLDFKMKTKKIIQRFKPDLIHVSTPSFLVFAAIIWAKFYNIPLVMSYHTNLV
jgi:sulfoquinovosyltransferase